MHHPDFVLGIGLPQGGEWLVIALALLLIFGKRLPEVMRSLGSGVNEFKKGIAGDMDHPPVLPPTGAVERQPTATSSSPPPALLPPPPTGAGPDQR